MDINNERSFQDILQDIFKKLEQIVRDELRLARTELGAEAVRAARAGKLAGEGLGTRPTGRSNGWAPCVNFFVIDQHPLTSLFEFLFKARSRTRACDTIAE